MLFSSLWRLLACLLFTPFEPDYYGQPALAHIPISVEHRPLSQQDPRLTLPREGPRFKFHRPLALDPLECSRGATRQRLSSL